MGTYTKHIIKYIPRLKKNGQPGKQLDMRLIAYTPLHTCDLCGKTSTPKKVHERNDVWGWNHTSKYDATKSKSLLCTGCWNKIRKFHIPKREIEETQKLIRKILRLTAKNRSNK
jgi:hypothetical protein